MYDYRKEMRADAIEHLTDYFGSLDNFKKHAAHIYKEDGVDVLINVTANLLMNNYDITGKGNNSYFCDRYEAEDAVSHNWKLLYKALSYFDAIDRGISQGAEYCDVAIRNYLLHEVVVNLLTELIVLDGEA